MVGSYCQIFFKVGNRFQEELGKLVKILDFFVIGFFLIGLKWFGGGWVDVFFLGGGGGGMCLHVWMQPHQAPAHDLKRDKPPSSLHKAL